MNNWRHRWCFFLKLCWNNNSMMMIVSAAQHYERMTEHDFASRRATRHQHRPINAINGERASRSSSAYQHQIMQCNLVRRHLCVCLFFLIFFLYNLSAIMLYELKARVCMKLNWTRGWFHYRRGARPQSRKKISSAIHACMWWSISFIAKQTSVEKNW